MSPKSWAISALRACPAGALAPASAAGGGCADAPAGSVAGRSITAPQLAQNADAWACSRPQDGQVGIRLRDLSEGFDDACDSLAAADARARNAEFLLAPAQ